MTENTKTYYHLILDRSGSMEQVREQTLSGLNEQIQRIRELQQRFPQQEFIVNFTVFNHEVDHRLVLQDASKLEPLCRNDYIPEGMTALYDAIGMSISMLSGAAGKEIAAGKASAVVVVMTDGYENSSRTYSHRQVKGMIAELEQQPNWTFSYLGATIDAVEIAESLSFSRMNVRAFDRADTHKRMADLSKDILEYAEAKSRGKVKKDFLGDREE